jgi:DHA1 family tetracycline resistance protein-like MFS transporter
MQPSELQAPSPPEQPPAPSHRSALLTVFLVVFIDLLGFGIVLPLLPLYADEILLPLFPGEGQRVWRGVLLGLLMASFSAMQFFFAPLWGRLSDRIGRRPILLLGLSGSVVFYTLFGIASEIGLGEGGPHLFGLALALLFVSRLGAGVAGATIGTAQAVIADTTTPQKRAHGMALIGAAFGIGFTFGPLLGFASLFVPLAGAPGYLAALLSLLAFLFGLSRLPETRRAQSQSSLRRRIFDWQGTVRVLRTPQVGILVATFFLATFAFGGLESTLALVNKLLLTGEQVSRAQREQMLSREAARHTWTEQINFLIFAYIGLVLMLMQGFVYRRLVQRFGEVRFLRAGLVFMTLGLLGAVGVLLLLIHREMAPGTAVLIGSGLAVMTLAVIGFALLTPSIQALISRRSDPARQGEVLGVNQSAAALARVLGPFIGLSLFDLLASHILPYAFGAGLLFCVFLLSLRIQPMDNEQRGLSLPASPPVSVDGEGLA